MYSFSRLFWTVLFLYLLRVTTLKTITSQFTFTAILLFVTARALTYTLSYLILYYICISFQRITFSHADLEAGEKKWNVSAAYHPKQDAKSTKGWGSLL